MLGDRGKELWVKGIDSSGMLLYERYFPAQNDKLLFVFRKALWRLRMLSRWHNFINEGRADDVEMEIREAEWLNDKSWNGIEELEKSLRSELPELLLRITGRILPLRGRHWKLHYRNGEYGGFELQQSETDALAERIRICGQRGLSFARLEQLEKLRTCFQSLNRIIMEEPGSKRKTSRGMSVPDCCPDILDRLDELKKQRVNQTANLILAHALGMRHKNHDPATKCIRIENDIHGEYERIPGVEPAKFIVLENLSRYRFSQGRTKFENSRLMMWSHRAIRAKLVELCEVFGLTVLEVNAGYSSKFTPDGIPGFRAEEMPAQRVLNSKAAKFLKDRSEFSREYEQLVRIVELADKQGKTVLVPKEGGSIFVPFVPQDSDRHLEQADLNASYNIGLRGIAHPNNVLVHNKLLVSKDKKTKGVWTPSISSKRRKEIFKDKKFSIEGLDKDAINLFLTGCQCEELGQTSAITDDKELRSYRGRWMVGGGIFKDVKREFERCLRINLKRMGG